MSEMKTLNGYEIVDAKARKEIQDLQQGGIGGGSVPSDVVNTDENEHAVLGAALSGAWSCGTGWTDNGDGSFSHSSGTEPLVFTPNPAMDPPG